MNSKTKGNIGEAITLAEFTKRGIQVSIPFGDNARYDLIADFHDKLNKIQVKYCNQKIINGSISCPCASSTNHTTNKNYHTYENDIDYFVFYIAEWNVTTIISIKEIGSKKSICFRKDLPKSKNGNEIHLISDYSFEKFFNEENNIIDLEDNITQEDTSLIKVNNILQFYCIDCGKPVSKMNGRCASCAAKLQPRVVEDRPNREELKEMIRTMPFTAIGKKYGVTDNAIRKWCDSYNLPRKSSEIKKYSAEEWALV